MSQDFKKRFVCNSCSSKIYVSPVAVMWDNHNQTWSSFRFRCTSSFVAAVALLLQPLTDLSQLKFYFLLQENASSFKAKMNVSYSALMQHKDSDFLRWVVNHKSQLVIIIKAKFESVIFL